jgi:non-specific serine/threonine protein kinase/serine/threonine-protein kinase
MVTQARIYRAEKKYHQAEELIGQSIEIQRRVLGPENRETLNSMSQLAYIYYVQGNYAQAAALYSQCLDSNQKLLSPSDPIMLSILEYLGSSLGRVGRYEEAEKIFRELIHNTAPAQQGTAWYNFACIAAVGGHKDDALEHLGQAIDHGFNQADAMAQDDDLKSLQGDPRFDALVARARTASAKK